MELFTQQEIQAILQLLNRTPMSPAEMLFTTGFFQRLAAFCQPPKPPEAELDVEVDAQALADALAIAEALDESDQENSPQGESE